MAIFTPDWPIPSSVSAISTTRELGYSHAPFHEFNLATHVNDDYDCVHQNRQLLIEQASLPEPPRWLTQTHSNIVIHSDNWFENIEGDACFSNQPNQVCVVMTADCLPLLICNNKGTEVAAVHAGWRGLANDIIANTLQQFSAPPKELLVWLGPAIGPKAFEVGQDVFDIFTQRDPQSTLAFESTNVDHYLADIYLLAKQQLSKLGVTQIFGGDRCTFQDSNSFFSYRRDGETGRMASMIWLNKK
jgi:hypothetical protein